MGLTQTVQLPTGSVSQSLSRGRQFLLMFMHIPENTHFGKLHDECTIARGLWPNSLCLNLRHGRREGKEGIRRRSPSPLGTVRYFTSLIAPFDLSDCESRGCREYLHTFAWWVDGAHVGRTSCTTRHDTIRYDTPRRES